MRQLRLFIRAFFGFSRMETNAFLILIPLVFVILFSEPVYHNYIETSEPIRVVRLDSLLLWINTPEHQLLDTIPLHPFDPNTATQDELVNLQLEAPIAARVVRYREKGGRFYKKEDVQKIFGMDSVWYRRAQRWMTFPAKKTDAKQFTARNVRPERTREDINTADTLQLMDVYGIGPVLARRITRFRDRLGGFITMRQLHEVYGLDSVVVDRLEKRFQVKDRYQPKQIDIGEVTLEELLSHPYMTRRQAHAILTYRQQHGELGSLSELLNVKLLDTLWLERIRPYLRITEKQP